MSSEAWPRRPVPGQFSLVNVVWNSIGNLRTKDEQPVTRDAPLSTTAPADAALS